jgi:Tol biopolymer transport system component
MIPNDRAPDERLVFMNFEKGPSYLASYSPGEREVKTIGPGAEVQFSPDGKWIVSSGRPQAFGEVIVEPFPGPGARIQISNGGGSQPRWSRDGKQIFYIAPDKKLMAASFDPKETIGRLAAGAFSDAYRRVQVRVVPV